MTTKFNRESTAIEIALAIVIIVVVIVTCVSVWLVRWLFT